MIQCPKCGAMNPEGFRNCRECYHPFGLEKAFREMERPSQPPPPRQQTPGMQPLLNDPVSGKTAQVLAVRPLRRIPVALWVALAVLLVAAIFLVAWFLTRGSGSGSYLEGVFDNMEALQGWEADVRVDSSEFPVDMISYYLGNSWSGTLVFQGPDRFSLAANSLQGGDSYGMRVIEGTVYEWDSYSRVWRNLGPADDYLTGTNPIWGTESLEAIPVSEEESLQDVEGYMCKVLSFDHDVIMTEESVMQDYEVAYHYEGKIYVDSATDLLVAIDYIVEIPELGRSHYRYDFHSLGTATSVEVPPGAIEPLCDG